MEKQRLALLGQEMEYYRCEVVVVGSGAAGFACVDRLHEQGCSDVLLVTEGINQGTSRNTGSDKQTYYKLTNCGDMPDSVEQMARTYFEGESMDGDLALCEAASSSRCFFYLCEAGVNFPFNEYGEYTGYKTDHDPAMRATSVGPLTSKEMTEALQRRASLYGIPILDGVQMVRLLKQDSSCCGLLGLRRSSGRWVLINAGNVVCATGGPAGIYATSVYPSSQSGATGVLLQAGVCAKNLTEWQYGMASIRFRWNVSGSYQQVLPRFVSTAPDGSDPREFLPEGFASSRQALNAQFLKGYQWPFDPRKAAGSSLVDILVFREMQEKHRRVWMDFRHNPDALDVSGPHPFGALEPEAYNYLQNCGCVQATPFQRLAHMNPGAIELYRSHGIDLAQEMLEIAVCAQHNNGGIGGDIWWESDLPHLFVIGEVNGSHGVYRPGGSALNAGQVGALRASLRIAHGRRRLPADTHAFLSAIQQDLSAELNFAATLLQHGGTGASDIRKQTAALMSHHCAHIRSAEKVAQAAEQLESLEQALYTQTGTSLPNGLAEIFQTRDLLCAARAVTESIRFYIQSGGGSRGSYLVENAELDDGRHAGLILETRFTAGHFSCTWRPVRPIPHREQWFETMWREFRQQYNKQEECS